MARRNLGERLEGWTKRSVAVVGLLAASGLVTAVAVLGGGGLSLYDWYQRTYDWRDQEYEKITSLHAGYARERFRAELGTPAFDRRSEDGRYREETFKRREYWAQIVSARDGTVHLYSVTACGRAFKPEFEFPGVSGVGEGMSAQVRLNESSFASVLGEDAGVTMSYFASGATANTKLFDVLPSSNPTNYKTVAWGLNDVCSKWFDYYETLTPWISPGWTRGPLASAPDWVPRLRREVVNTYAETAPLVSLPDVRRAFDIGADRILTRTTESGNE